MRRTKSAGARPLDGRVRFPTLHLELSLLRLAVGKQEFVRNFDLVFAEAQHDIPVRTCVVEAAVSLIHLKPGWTYPRLTLELGRLRRIEREDIRRLLRRSRTQAMNRSCSAMSVKTVTSPSGYRPLTSGRPSASARIGANTGAITNKRRIIAMEAPTLDLCGSRAVRPNEWSATPAWS